MDTSDNVIGRHELIKSSQVNCHVTIQLGHVKSGESESELSAKGKIHITCHESRDRSHVTQSKKACKKEKKTEEDQAKLGQAAYFLSS